MPVSYTYALYPFPWNAATNCHEPPAGSACVIDLRPLSEQAKSSQSSGYGLFAWASGVPGDAVSLGTGYAPELVIDNAARVELRTKLGLAANPSGATLADAMADVLGSLADPTGASMAKPLMPTSDGALELHLEGHSRVWSAKIDAAEVLSANPKGKHNRIRDVIRADLDEAERIGGASMLQKCLGAWLLKLGVSREELKAGAGGRKAQYDRLMSTAVKAKHGAEAKPRKPESSFSESWPTNAADLTGSAQDNTWSELAVDGFADGLKVASGTLRSTAAAYTTKLGICSSAVSSADHWTEASITATVGAGFVLVGCRQAASRGTFYGAGFYYSGARRLYKYVNGAGTQLATGAYASFPALVRCSANGSTITGTWPTLGDQTVTDTSITGNLQGSAMIYLDALVDTYGQVGAWSIDDGLSSSGAAGSVAFIGDSRFF